MKTVTVLAGRLFDPESLQLVPNQAISISPQTGEILDVQAITSDLLANLHPSATDTLDLRHLTILPGLVDAHVHSELLQAYEGENAFILALLSVPAFVRGEILG
jgi:imidazolonepropionase-like amidohydrolase